MKMEYLILGVGAIIALLVISEKTKAAAAIAAQPTEGEYYAGTAAGVIEDLF